MGGDQLSRTLGRWNLDLDLGSSKLESSKPVVLAVVQLAWRGVGMLPGGPLPRTGYSFIGNARYRAGEVLAEVTPSLRLERYTYSGPTPHMWPLGPFRPRGHPTNCRLPTHQLTGSDLS